MLRNRKDEQEKEWLRLERERHDLWKRMRDDGVFVDVTPYQHGWFQKYDLRDDVKNRSDVAAYRQALDLVNVTIHNHRKDFKVRDYETRRWKDQEHPLKRLTQAEYDGLNEKLKSLFEHCTWIEGRRPRHVHREGYKLRNEFYFVKVQKPAMVHQKWIPNADAATRHAQLDNRFAREQLWDKLGRLHGHRVSRDRKEYNARRFKFLEEGVFDVEDVTNE